MVSEKSSKIINTSFPSLSVQKDLNISQMDPIDKRLLSRPKAKVTTTLCVAPKYPLTLLPYADSLLLNRHRCIADASLFHSRQFRVGWGAEKFLYHIGKGLEMQKSPVQRGKGKIQQLEEPFQVSIEKISLYNDYKPVSYCTLWTLILSQS